MTLDEVIAYAREVAWKNKNNDERNTIIIPNIFISNIDCAEKYEQVAEWLEDYKHLRNNRNSLFNFDEVIGIQCENARRNAIDDFQRKVESWCWKHQDYNQDDLNELMEISKRIIG